VLYPRYCGSLGNRTLANVFFDNLVGVSIRRLITPLMPFGSFACGPQELCNREYRYPEACLTSYSGGIRGEQWPEYAISMLRCDNSYHRFCYYPCILFTGIHSPWLLVLISRTIGSLTSYLGRLDRLTLSCSSANYLYDT